MSTDMCMQLQEFQRTVLMKFIDSYRVLSVVINLRTHMHIQDYTEVCACRHMNKKNFL